jgi:hypothetical protein
LSEAATLSRSLVLATRGDEPAEADRLAVRLAALDPLAISGDEARIAFWVNVYNALLLRELARAPRTGSLLRNRRMFRTAACRVGEHDYSLDVIEHGVLRRNARVPARPARTLRRGDPRLGAIPSRLEPRIHFALNCGAVSCPPIVPYSAAALDEELERVTTAYLRAETSIDRERGRVTLPYLMRLYRGDFGDRSERLQFAARRLDKDDACWLRSQSRVRLDYGKFDWTLAPPTGRSPASATRVPAGRGRPPRPGRR